MGYRRLLIVGICCASVLPIGRSFAEEPAKATPAGKKSQLRKQLPSPWELIRLGLEVKKALDAGKIGDVVEPLKRLLEIEETLHGEDQPGVVMPLATLSLAYSDIGDFSKAKECLERAMKIQTRTDKTGFIYAMLLTSYGVVHWRCGELKEANENLYDALEISLRRQLDTTVILARLAAVAHSSGDLIEARRLSERSLETARQHSPGSVETAIRAADLASTLADMGEFDAAVELFQQAIEIEERLLSANHPHLAATYHNTGVLLSKMREFEMAKDFLLRAVEIDEAALGVHSQTAAANEQLGIICWRLKDLESANKYFKRSLEIAAQVNGKDHLNNATGLVNYASLLVDENQLDEARANYDRALAIFERNLSATHEYIGRTLERISALEAKRGRWNEAASLADRSRHVLRSNCLQVLPALAEREQLSYLAKDELADLHSALAIGLACSDNQRLVELSADWLINGKGMAQEASVQRTLAIRNASGQAGVNQLQSLLEVQEQLASLSRVTTKAEAKEQHEARIAQLTTEATELTRHLIDSGVVPAHDNWISLAEIRLAIPEKGMLINVVRTLVPRINEAPEQSRARYVVWLIPRAQDGDVAIIDLGPADKIDELVSKTRHELQNRLPLTSLNELSSLVYAPMAPRLARTERWFVSPDASLWLLPWQVLLIGPNQYAIEKYTISYVMSGRELLNSTRREKWQTPGLALANPDFSATPQSADSSFSSPILAVNRSMSAEARQRGGGLPDKWENLPGTQAEIDQVLPYLRNYLKADPEVRTGPDATKAAFKKAIRPRVVLCSTHAFSRFSAAEAEPSGMNFLIPSLAEGSPLLRTGLVLAGANRHLDMTDDEFSKIGIDDGILTGLEIVGADLRGTELVVLSACDTGFGDLRSGEGVASLRQAFQLAGADAVMASLWKIEDQETALLMEQFWRNMSTDSDAPHALQAAQLFVLRHTTKGNIEAESKKKDSSKQRGPGEKLDVVTEPKPVAVGGPAHEDDRTAPYYWAAFTLTGK